MFQLAQKACQLLKRKAHVYRLCPTAEQARTLTQWIGCTRLAYNLALEQRKTFFRPGRSFNIASQSRDITALRADFDWIRSAPAQPLHQAIRDLDRAYQNWWSGRAKAPTPRKRGVHDSMRFTDSETLSFCRLSRHVGKVKIPKLGWVRLRWDKRIPGTVKNITISHKAGQWFVSAQYEYEAHEPANSNLPSVGIDRGVALFAALSDGRVIEAANPGRKAQKALARAQRRLSRKKKGSKNRAKQRLRVAKIHARIARCRKDFLHKLSHDIASNYGLVALEKLEVRNMTRSAKGTKTKPGKRVRQKAGMNRSILDQGWGMFGDMLAYKLADRGGTLVKVPAHHTSQTCSACGAVDVASRVSQSKFCCTSCGHEANADINAAINILRRADSPLLPVEAVGCHADEAGTIQRAA
ncbi:RNA-guided endonuclease TnpB family protein [Roseicella sp. DB1501]|uniref:RNA-guided endonuclease InsQ/TnpB family protein n=1 Tax=Roseicella sp. DB1501 TaxID=2730925 RepID=UPI0014912DEC|nr:RNA-guided endonuclease TnpB family protein [Roseicella sp. DB1501]